MNSVIKKAVFPVAGIGSRFLPATKASPKEMLPIVDKPLIQYAVEEAISAGIRELIFVTSSTKRSIEDHFESNFDLEAKLEAEGKEDLLDIVRQILPKGVSCAYVRQSDTLGLGHAVLCAKHLVHNQPFAVLLADDLIDGEGQPCLKQMMSLYEKTHQSIIAIQEVSQDETEQYGIVQLNRSDTSSNEIQHIVEKPKRGTAPSNLGVVGRYLLTPTIFSCLENTTPGIAGEIQLTDAIEQLLKIEKVYGCIFKGKRYDCGSKLGYLQATVAYGLKHPEVGNEFKEFLSTATHA